MAQSIKIHTKENIAKIIVDGNEIHDVLSCELAEDSKLCILTLKAAVMGEVEVLR